MKRIFTLLLFLAFQVSYGQDVVKLYVLFDISGSTHATDIHENLRALTGLLLREDKDSAQSALSIELITFGENAEVKSLDLYANGIAKSRNDLMKFLNDVSKRSRNSPKQKYTHLLKALNKIDLYSKKSFGVFIFADGRLNSTDVEGGDNKVYCDSIRAAIRILESNKKPVFLVQSSVGLINDYYEIPQSFTVKSDSLNVSSNFFWLRADVDYSKETHKSITQIFEKFMLQAIFRIQNYERTPSDDVIAKFLTLAEWFRYFELSAKMMQMEVNKVQKSETTYRLDSAVKELFNKPVPLKPEKDQLMLEKAIPQPKKKDDEMPSSGGVKRLSPVSVADISVLQPSTEVSFKDLLTDIRNRLQTSGDLSPQELDALHNRIQSLVKHQDFKLMDTVLAKFKKSNREVMQLIAQNGSLELPNFSVASSPAQFFNFTVPADDKYRDLQQAIVLGLTDYLIKRTKQEALFASLEIVNQNVFEPSTYIRDTLFYHTAKLFETLDPAHDSYFEPDLVLIKEAFNQDMDLITTSLIKHPKVRTSNGLVSLLYTVELINNLTKGNTLEESLKNIVEKLPVDSLSSGPLERGLLFTCHLIQFLEQHDLALLYQQNSSKTLSDFSKIIAIYLAKQYPDIHQINDIEVIGEQIRLIYLQYEQLKKNLDRYNKEINALKPTSNFTEYQQYKRQLSLQILRECAEFLLSGVDLAGHYTNLNSGELKQNINSIRTVSTTAVECWFLIQDKKYAEAAAHLIPMIPKLPVVKMDTTNEFLSRYGALRSSINLIALKNDTASIRRALKNELVDFSKKMYTSLSKEDALAFLARNQLTFLTPLLLHVRDSLVTAANVAKANKVLIWEVRLPEGLTIEEVVQFYREAFQKFDHNSFKVDKLLAKLRRKAMESKWTEEAKEHLTLQLLRYFSIDGLDENLKKMVAIAGEISTANTAAQVENVIDKYALPVASYRIKRSTVHSWMVNAYVGGGGTWYQKKNTIAFTLSAPIGIEHAWRFRNQSGSFSLFASVIDVGNVINYRLNQAEETDKTFLLENVASPGLFAMLGVSRRFPLSIGVGYQVNPQRASAFVAFDLPLFRLK